VDNHSGKTNCLKLQAQSIVEDQLPGGVGLHDLAVELRGPGHLPPGPGQLRIEEPEKVEVVVRRVSRPGGDRYPVSTSSSTPHSRMPKEAKMLGDQRESPWRTTSQTCSNRISAMNRRLLMKDGMAILRMISMAASNRSSCMAGRSTSVSMRRTPREVRECSCASYRPH